MVGCRDVFEHLARGKALMALSVDSEPPPELVEQIRGAGFDDVRFINLG